MIFAEDVEARFDTLNMKQKHYIAYRKKNEKVIGLMKDEFGGKVMTKFIGLKAKSYSQQMTAVKIKKQESQKSVPSKENLNLKSIKTVQKQPNFIIK